MSDRLSSFVAAGLKSYIHRQYALTNWVSWTGEVQYGDQYQCGNDHNCQQKIWQTTYHKSQLVIGLDVSLCPTYSFATHIHYRPTNLSYWGGRGGLLRPRGPTPSSSINLPPSPYSLTEYLPPYQSQYEINQVIFLTISQA